MSDVNGYIQERDEREPGFREQVENEYEKLRIGERIRRLRVEQGMSQEELARKLHTTKSAVSRMENHAESVRLETLEKVASVFNKTLTILFQ